MDWRAILTYDPGTGNLIWKPKPDDAKDAKRWNKRYAHKVAGYERPYRIDVRVYVRIGPTATAAHNIVWEMHHGPMAHGFVPDHIDGNTLNNRIENLRPATNSQNACNSRARSNARSGLKGVAYRRGAWVARIMIRGRAMHIGQFRTKGMAAVARAKAAIRYHGAFARFT
jgi:hypothetical protein